MCSTDRNLSDKRSFYSILNPNIHPEKRNFAAQWLHNIGNGWSVKIFKVASHRKVCEDPRGRLQGRFTRTISRI